MVQLKRENNEKKENLIDQKVTYTLEFKSEVYIVENAPARVNEETVEQYFTPSTVEQLHKTILRKEEKPKRMQKTPVYEYH